MTAADFASDKAAAADLSVIIPAKNESVAIGAVLRLLGQTAAGAEVIVVCDDAADPTLAALATADAERLRLRAEINAKQGVAEALKLGLSAAKQKYVAIVMADGSDDLTMLQPALTQLRNAAADVVVGSRFAPGGALLGAPWLKGKLSSWASYSLSRFFSFPSSDATNAFFVVRRDRLSQFALASRVGFTVAFECKIRLWRSGATFLDLPTVWRERASGKSKFRLLSWLPHYLRWYFVAVAYGLKQRFFGRKLHGRG